MSISVKKKVATTVSSLLIAATAAFGVNLAAGSASAAPPSGKGKPTATSTVPEISAVLITCVYVGSDVSVKYRTNDGAVYDGAGIYQGDRLLATFVGKSDTVAFPAANLEWGNPTLDMVYGGAVVSSCEIG